MPIIENTAEHKAAERATNRRWGIFACIMAPVIAPYWMLVLLHGYALIVAEWHWLKSMLT